MLISCVRQGLCYAGPIRLFLDSTPSLNIIFLAEVSNFVIVIYVGPLSLRQGSERRERRHCAKRGREAS